MPRFIACNNSTDEYGDIAALLIAMAEEMQIHPRDIAALPTGFLVPDAIADVLDGPRTPPESWNEPQQAADIEVDAEGRVFLTAEAQRAILESSEGVEVAQAIVEDTLEHVSISLEQPKGPETAAIRSWARENGLDVPARGKLAQEVVDAYFEAFPGE